jgi:hypothetical protein
MTYNLLIGGAASNRSLVFENNHAYDKSQECRRNRAAFYVEE